MERARWVARACMAHTSVWHMTIQGTSLQSAAGNMPGMAAAWQHDSTRLDLALT